MKIDFNKPLLNFKGEILEEPRTGQAIFAKDVVCNTLSNVINAAKEEKLTLDLVTARIWDSKEDVEISPEEAVLIRKHIEGLPTGLFSQIYRLLG